MAIPLAAAYTKGMVTNDDRDFEHLINQAAERAVGFYYEKTRHDIDLVMEAIDGMKVQVDKIPRIEADVAELKTDMKVVKIAVSDTNRDLQSFHTPGWIPGKSR